MGRGLDHSVSEVPLDLYLQFYVEEDDEFKDVLTQRGKKFLEYILTQFGPKVRSLNVMGLPSLFPILHLLPSSSLLSLEEISFHIINNDDDTIEDLVDIFPRKPEVFLGSSKLRKVEVNNVSFLEFLALPGEQLTSLKVGEDRFTFDPVMLLDMLPQFKQLVALEIVTPVDRFSGFSPDLSILLPTLKSLDVFFFNTVDNILRCITTPLLDRLSITYHRQDLDSLVMDMARFQQRSSTALSSLVFCLRSSAADERLDHTEKVIAVLSLFPAIRSLEIHTRALLNPDPLIQAMTCTEGHYVLPNLQDLVLERYMNYSDQPKRRRLSSQWFWVQVYGPFTVVAR
ncbi:hypothetical protein BT96DRAFT_292940 [Gymnopus androsaceus JB14]|uniref:F-box domain-containing protein n=1 Tax=Gymnopus androsaceus JB14 TaxID=1447944 RepID=A0A6A4IAW7_9AGAR|nr:hypothetical protein BT96DRAFT_292940 [Gymnopus androsaceus JB14]